MQKDKYIPRYTYADYSLWEGDWELIDGHPYAVAPSPFGPHQAVVVEFVSAILIQLKKNACQCQVFADLDWIINDEGVVRPDVMIACGDKIKKHLEYAPVWILEILSESTAFRDQIIKKELYAEQGVRYYLIADPAKKEDHKCGNNEKTDDGEFAHDDWFISPQRRIRTLLFQRLSGRFIYR